MTCGPGQSYAAETLEGPEGQRCRLISVPSFAKVSPRSRPPHAAPPFTRAPASASFASCPYRSPRCLSPCMPARHLSARVSRSVPFVLCAPASCMGWGSECALGRKAAAFPAPVGGATGRYTSPVPLRGAIPSTGGAASMYWTRRAHWLRHRAVC